MAAEVVESTVAGVTVRFPVRRHSLNISGRSFQCCLFLFVCFTSNWTKIILKYSTASKIVLYSKIKSNECPQRKGADSVYNSQDHSGEEIMLPQDTGCLIYRTISTVRYIAVVGLWNC